MPRREGQFLVEDYFLNIGGLNTADSPFVVPQDCATGGKNFDYVKRGGVQKRSGHTKQNVSANAELRTIGIGLWNKPGVAREIIRAAGRKLQNYDFDALSFTNLTEDTTAAGSNFFAADSTQPVVNSMFNTSSAGVLWHAGGGLTIPYGVYSDSKVTKNGVDAPTTSAFTATPVGSGGTIPAGVYRYTLVYRKLSTQALSNALTATEASVTCGANDSVTLAWTLSNNDTTKYDKIYVYRSAAAGSAGFTAGALVTILNSSATGYTDTNSLTSSSENVPRAGGTVDNSTLSAGTYNTTTTFKRRLVTATGSSLYISDINKPESWPAANLITIPSGGDITGLAVISLTTPSSPEIEEVLCIFKQTELWVVTGNSVSDWVLKYVDNSGCAVQSLIVPADGHLAWVSYRGIYLWNGAGKPACISQAIEDKFAIDGDLNKSKLVMGFGVFFQRRNEIEWFLSSKAEGEQRYVLKLDLRLLNGASQGLIGQDKVRGVFTPDVTAFPLYAGSAFIRAADSTEEVLLLGDNAGYIYTGYIGAADGGSDITWQYTTPYLHQGMPSSSKRYHKVVAWVMDSGPFDLNLDFWTDYRFQDSEKSSIELPVSATTDDTIFTWDVGAWDEVLWDTSSNTIKGLGFNLNSNLNNTEGDCLRLRFTETSADRTVLLYGFSVYYTDLTLRK